MPSRDPVITARNRLAGLHRNGPADPAAVVVARRDLTAAHVERAILKGLDAEPALTPAQRDRLAALLRPGSSR